jgi:hypothetical protein
MSEPVLSFDPARTTNAIAIVDAALLGYLDGEVLDNSVGPAAGFWTKWRPDVLVTNDLDPAVEADYHYDARVAPFDSRSFDTVVWDPPYGYRGTSRLPSDARYGLAGPYLTVNERLELLVAGTLEALRLARRYVLVKCQDARVSARHRSQTMVVAQAVAEHGGRLEGVLHVIGGHRGQPAGKRQLGPWTNYSTLMVFQPKKEKR